MAAFGRGRRRAEQAPAEQRALFDEAFLRRLEYLEIVARKAFAGAARGERRARKIGGGLEFADHRRYSPGDDFRNIDWNVYQRLGKLLIRLYEEEEDLYVYLLVDASGSMVVGGREKLDHALELTAALAYITLAGLDRVSIIPFSETLGPRLMPARGKGQIFKIFDFLSSVEPGGKTHFHDALRPFVHQTRRPGLAVVISDLYSQDGYEEGLNLLRYHRFEPLVIHLHDERELHPELRGDVVLVDCETGSEKELTLTPRVLERYRAAHTAWREEVDAFCRARQIPYFGTAIQTPFDDLMLQIFRAGGFLR